MQKSKKSFVVYLAALQRLAPNRLGPFSLTAWSSTTYNICFVGTKKAPHLGG